MIKVLKNDDKQFPVTVELNPDNRQIFTKKGFLELIKLSLNSLSDDERMDMFSEYCKYCGENNPNCQCWNDE